MVDELIFLLWGCAVWLLGYLPDEDVRSQRGNYRDLSMV
jgi:hypothetical protein